MEKSVHIIGGGLAGCEAAWQLATRGVPCVLHEMRPKLMTDVHKTDGLAELVCSNSFRSDDSSANAVGVLHEEMRRCNSIIMGAADETRLPAGSALAVDRILFSKAVEDKIKNEHLIQVQRDETTMRELGPNTFIIVASGPLTSDRLAHEITSITGHNSLAFFDAIAPVVYKDTIDFSKAWFQSRYDRDMESGGNGDYINCPLSKCEYENFVNELLTEDPIEFKEWEKKTPYFEGCMPIEEIARRGFDTLRFGPMKPVGLTNPNTGERPYAVVQLRQDNATGTLYNMVGFQTKARHGAQKNLFRKIPGLENANFARLGGLHRNTFINSPQLLDPTLRFSKKKSIRFAGQITGVEGYLESAAIGLLAGVFTANDYFDEDYVKPPATTALASLLAYITNDLHQHSFQPMNINFGLFPPLSLFNKKDGKQIVLKGLNKKNALAKRALNDIKTWSALT